MHVTRYIRVWGLYKDMTPCGRNNQDTLEPVTQPSVPKLDEMLPMDREGEGRSLPGSKAMSCNWDEGELGPSSLGHIYREGSIQSLWRPVLGGIPGAGSTGSGETLGASLPTPGSVMAHWELRVSHGGNVYITEVRKYYIPCTLLLLRELTF